jgi:hypothetical protein
MVFIYAILTGEIPVNEKNNYKRENAEQSSQLGRRMIFFQIVI